MLPNPHPASVISGKTPQDQGAALFLPALLYLFVPAALVLFYFSAWPMVAAVASGVAAVFLYLKAGRPKAQLLSTWPYLLLAAGMVWLSGTLPPFAENTDWHKHYAVFNALASQSWPPKFITGDGAATLRYSLGYYAIPALVAKWSGAGMLAFAIFVWSTLGCYFALVLAFGAGARTPIRCFLLGLVFLLFSGADIVGTYLTGAYPAPPTPLLHFEWWSGFGVLPSSVTSIFWTPQHLIAGWVAAFLFIRYPRQAVRHAGVIMFAAAIWSPFAAVGLVPTLAWAVWTSGWRALLTGLNFIAAPVLLLLAALFLGQGSEGIPFSLIWNAAGFSVKAWILFVFLEFLLIALALLLLDPAPRKLVLIHAAFLLVLSSISVGALNDLLMRASIPALGILAVCSAQALVYQPNSVKKVPLLLLLVIGMVTPLCEIWRGVVAPRIKEAKAISMLNIIDGNPGLKAQYFVPSNEKISMLPPVLRETDLTFTTYGEADFDLHAKRVSAAAFVDAAMMSQPVSLPAGYYKLDATLDWHIVATSPGVHGGHVSVHGVKMLVPLMTSEAKNKAVSRYFYSDGKPFQISFGLGGWGIGSGFVELKTIVISPVQGWRGLQAI